MFIKDNLEANYTRQEALTSSRWLLLFVGGLHLQVGLIQVLQSTEIAGAFLSVGSGFVLFALTPFYWIHFLLVVGWTMGLVIDLYLRKNVFSIFFIIVGIFHAYHLFRCSKRTEDDLDDA